MTILIENAEVLVTMDGARREIEDGAVLIRGNRFDALLTCAPVNPWLSIIGGRVVVEQGEIVGLDLPALIEQHNQQAQRIQRGAAIPG